MVKTSLWKIAKIIIAVGLTLVVWTLIIGPQGFDGPSVVKENIWKGIQETYANILVTDTDCMGYGYSMRLDTVWTNTNGGVEHIDSRCTIE